MFIPANSIIKCTSLVSPYETFTCTVLEIPFDFDAEFVNGVKVIRHQAGNEEFVNGVKVWRKDGEKGEYVDDIKYQIDVVKFPDEYFTPLEFYLVLKNKLDDSYMFCTDTTYVNNKWMKYQMDVIETLAGNQSYRQAYRTYKSKYLTENGN